MGTKPCLLFSGADFESDTDLRRLKSLLMDFYQGPVVNNVRLSGKELLNYNSVTQMVIEKSDLAL